MPPLHFFATSNSVTFTSPGHFNRDQSSAGVYTSFHMSTDTSGFLECGALIFFRLHSSGNVKSKVCMAVTHEARLHTFTPIPHFLFRITSRSDARGNARRRDPQQHPPYRWVSRALVRQRHLTRKATLAHSI